MSGGLFNQITKISELGQYL